MAYVKKSLATQIAEIKHDSYRFLVEQNILVDLRKYYLRKQLTWDNYSELRKQALDGDVDGARKALAERIKWRAA